MSLWVVITTHYYFTFTYHWVIGACCYIIEHIVRHTFIYDIIHTLLVERQIEDMDILSSLPFRFSVHWLMMPLFFSASLILSYYYAYYIYRYYDIINMPLAMLYIRYRFSFFLDIIHIHYFPHTHYLRFSFLCLFIFFSRFSPYATLYLRHIFLRLI